MLTSLKDTIRLFRHNPGFTATVIATLALGIGANTAVFSLVDTVLLKPLRAPGPERLVQFQDTSAGLPSATASPRHFNAWRSETEVFQDVSAHWLEHFDLTGTTNPELIPAALVSASFFRLYGMRTVYGRTFSADEDRPGGSRVVVLSDSLWARQFRADPTIIGHSVFLGAAAYQVIGILARGSSPELFDEPPEAWVPFQIDPSDDHKDSRLCLVTGRLRLGITLDAARARLRLAADEYRRRFPGTMRPNAGFNVQSLREAMVGNVQSSLWLLAGAVSFVLLLACANGANLMLIHASGRRHELAVRTALGASRKRIIG